MPSGSSEMMMVIVNSAPLGMLGGVIGYIAYKTKRAAAEQAPVALETVK